MKKILKTKTGVIATLCVLAVMVGVLWAAIAPRNQTYRAGAKFYTTYGMAGTATAAQPLFVAPYPGYISRVGFVSTAGVAAADTVTNYHTWYFVNIASSTVNETLATYTTLHKPGGITPTAYASKLFSCDSTKNYMAAGEVAYVSYVKTSSPTSLGITYYFVEFIPSGGFAPTGVPNAYKGIDQ